MGDEPMRATDRVVAPTPGPVITIPETANEFAIKGNHLTLIKGNQFDDRTKTDPHKHIHEFLSVCDMFKYRETENEAVRLMMFPLSLTGEAKTWLDELNEGTIESWDELRSSNSSTDKIMTRMDAMTMKMDAQYKEIQSRAKCNHYGETFMGLKNKLETTTKNHQATIQNLEAKFDRLADKQSARPSGALPSNTQPNPRGTVFIFPPRQFYYPERKLTMEEMLNEFINECKREHEEMRIFINEFRTTNELLLKEQNNLLNELEIEVCDLGRVMRDILVLRHDIKGVTIRGGKMTSEPTYSKEVNIDHNQPPGSKPDEPDKPNEVVVENKPPNILDHTT
ncbi:hypothetical protein Tco_0573122 [Tanacetum coccineum]